MLLKQSSFQLTLECLQKIINDLLVCTGQTLGDIDEITLEANPGDLTQALLEQFIEAGVSRLSLGIQVRSLTSKSAHFGSI